jgi:enoyl-CoA hydratase/carnithine racemase
MSDRQSGSGADPEVHYELRDNVALITLHRPHRLNAFTPKMQKTYRGLLADAECDPGVSSIVVTGAGRAFCAGADLEGVARAATEAAYPAARKLRRPPSAESGLSEQFARPVAFHWNIGKPVVAAINGPAVGLGFVIAAYCDVRFAADDAFFAANFGRLGLPVEFGLSWVLPRLIGTSRAMEILLSSRRVTATEALQAGLVSRVLPVGDLVDAAVAYAADAGHRCPGRALAETKRQVYEDLLQDFGTAYDRSMALVDEMVASADFRQAVASMGRDPRRSDPPSSGVS